MRLLFSNVGEYEPCGMFSKGHFALICITITCIFIALKQTWNKSKEEVYMIIKNITIIMCILEVLRIIYSIMQNSIYAVNTYMPLYYCSILLYAGLLSSFGKGVLKRVGDVSLATGAIIGGIVFIIFPSTSLTIYPAFHILSIHSFLFHGTMIYLGILVNKTRYIDLEKEDAKYFASLIGIMGILAFTINNLFDGNLMFISENFPGTPIETFYKLTGGEIMFSLIMITVQMTIPFYISYYVIEKIHSMEHCEELEAYIQTNK